MADAPNNGDQEFQDPLQNYDPRRFDDPLEQALHEQTVTAVQFQPCTSIPPETTIAAALQQLASGQVACLLIAEGGKLVGVFSDRDFLAKVALEYDALKDEPVSRVMTKDPVFVYETQSAAAALCVMAVSGFRHVPVVDLDRKLIGIISPQRVTRFFREHAKPA